MRVIYSCIIAFSMYSKIPMPHVEWTKENMKYVMCFFPAVGLVIGTVFYLWGKIGQSLHITNTLYTAVFLLIPVIITGGIHMDGLLDTADALSSYQSKERRLEILKDSNAGAFAVIVCCVYFIAGFGFLSEVDETILPLISLSFCFSRILSGLSVALFPCAKTSGLAALFADGADKKRTVFILAGEGIAVFAGFVFLHPVYGTAMGTSALLVFFYYRRMSEKKFGGITGDLAGYFLQICELFMLIIVTAVHIWMKSEGGF